MGLVLIAIIFCISATVQAVTLSQERVIFHTNAGDLAVALYPKVAPKHVEQILKMVKAGVYTGMRIYRVEPGFVAQVENFDAREVPLNDVQRATVNKIPAEFSAIPHRRGLLSMARYDEDINSAEASFSFMLGDAPHLDGQYTIFGELVSGDDVLKAIEEIPVANGDEPMAEIIISSAEIVDAATLGHFLLKPAQHIEIPGMNGKMAFEIFAALMFSFTVILPIIRSLTPKKLSGS